MKILLIGHQGYVGTGLHAELSKRHDVLGWGRKENLFSLRKERLRREKVRVVINLAAEIERVSIPFEIGSASDRVNVEGARHLASVLRGTGVGWIQISTKDVFGSVFKKKDVYEKPRAYRPAFLVDDDAPFHPETIYAKSKLMSEIICESHKKSDVIRLSTCYTDFYHPRGNWMAGFIKKALLGKPVGVTGNGKQFRDPLHVIDLARLIESLVKKNIYGEKMNAGGGEKNILSLLEFLAVTGLRPSIEKMPGGDMGFAFNNAKAKKLTGWEPRVLLRERIPLMIENIRLKIER